MSATLTHRSFGERHRPAGQPGLFARLRTVLTTWRDRARARAHLSELDEHMLRDIGLEPGMVDREVHKPFWRA